MKVNGVDKKVNCLTFRHAGEDLNFQWDNRDHFGKPADYELEPKVSLRIDFSDIREIDKLIYALEEFKNFCTEELGAVKRLRAPFGQED